jgi:hypothetical protein
MPSRYRNIDEIQSTGPFTSETIHEFSYILFVLTFFVAVTLVFALPGEVKRFSSALVERNEEMCAVIAVLERDASVCHLFLGSLHLWWD